MKEQKMDWKLSGTAAAIVRYGVPGLVGTVVVIAAARLAQIHGPALQECLTQYWTHSAPEGTGPVPDKRKLVLEASELAIIKEIYAEMRNLSSNAAEDVTYAKLVKAPEVFDNLVAMRVAYEKDRGSLTAQQCLQPAEDGHQFVVFCKTHEL